jgi:hypothetical protein
MSIGRRHFATLGAAVLACAVSVHSQENGSDARARAALDDMRAAYQSLEAFHIKVKWTARYTGSMSADDFPLPGPDTIELRLQRPNKFFMAASAKRSGKPTSYTIVSDGTSLWYWRSATNTYTQTGAPTNLLALPKLLPPDAIGTMDGTSWNADSIMEWDLLTGGPDLVTEGSLAGGTLTMTGPEKLGNVPVAVVRMNSPDGAPFSFESRIYLGVENHLVRGQSITARGKNEDTGKDFSVVMQAVYEVHDARPRFGAADFTFVPPPGAKRGGAEHPETRKARRR